VTARDANRLVRLLPRAHRIRDAELGGPLDALLQVIAGQVQVVDDDIAQLYENWFIETCQTWVVPYIGDLIGYMPASPVTSAASISPDEYERGLRAAVPRRDVAHTIGSRRRKGTLALLEELARDAGAWPARAVEFFRLLAIAQSLEHPRLDRGRTVDLHRGDALERLDGPFDALAHTVSVGRVNSRQRRTRFNIPSVGLYVWRLRPYCVSEAPAFCIDRARTKYTFSLLGNDAPLITKPVAEPARTHVADEMNVPAWIRRRSLDLRTADYYGPGKSLAIWRDSPGGLVPVRDIVAADLSSWGHAPREGQVVVDPALGRFAFPAGEAPEEGVWVTYQYGFSADMGGGEYQRLLSPLAGRPFYRVGRGGEYRGIGEAIHRWQEDRDADPTKRSAVVEILDSGEYHEPIDITLREGDRLELRAAQGKRPLIRLLDWATNRPDSFRIRGVRERLAHRPEYAAPVEEHDAPAEGGGDATAEPPVFVLDGLLITGRSVWVSGRLECVVIRDSTLVPGWTLEPDCEPHDQEPSLELDGLRGRVLIERTILGGVRVTGEDDGEPIPFALSDSILDATDREERALCGSEGAIARVALSVLRSTVIGEICVHAIELAENSILDGLVRVVRRQFGCVRYCYVAPRSRTPVRHRCQPDLVEAAVRAAFEPGELDAAERDRAIEREANRVRPQFASVRYGTPQYCQLGHGCAPEITEGADDQSELGAFHDLFQPQRLANLTARLDEFTPAGTDAQVIFVT
jgi:hypothetical protein